MKYLGQLISRERLQYQVYLGMFGAALLLTGALYATDNRPFERFLGGWDPLLTALSIGIPGIGFLTALLSQDWFAIYRASNHGKLYRPAGFAAIMAIIMIIVDRVIRFPADTNIPFPQSLLFYPAIGFFAEILFHVLPITVIVAVLASIFGKRERRTIIWAGIFIVALLEPVYQVLWMAGQYPVWAVAYVGLHIYAFNLLQLIAFMKYDFVSMYALRLVYYAVWHIGWGYFRLQLLF